MCRSADTRQRHQWCVNQYSDVCRCFWLSTGGAGVGTAMLAVTVRPCSQLTTEVAEASLARHHC